MTFRFRTLLAAAPVIAGIAACGATGPRASQSTFSDTLNLYALNGAPAGAPTAVSLYGSGFQALAVHADASFRFDVAVDIDASGRLDLFPVRAVAGALASGHRVGLQTLTTPFDLVTSAPTTGFHYDSLVVVGVGSVLALQVADPLICATSFTSSVYYAKIAIDSLDAARRTARMRVTVDPNCGFISFGSGVPRN
jgi:hypothetical protein